MPLGEVPGLVAGAVALGVAHGIEPGHGWPVAATYALDKSARWFHGFAAGFLLGVGHLVSSIAVVVAYYLVKSYFGLAELNDPVSVAGVELGGRVEIVAGVLLVALGVREYRHGHSHGYGRSHSDDGHSGSEGRDHSDSEGHDHSDGEGHDHSHDDGHDHSDGEGHDHGHDDDGHDGEGVDDPVVALADHSHGHPGDHSHDHSHAHDHADDHSHGHTVDHSHGHAHSHAHERGLFARLKAAVPFVGGHSHAHGSMEDAADRGLWGIAGFAFLLGFAHEEEIEIIAICTGSRYCLELMAVYALTVIAGIVALTLLLVAGYTHFEERVSEYAEYLPTFSAVVLVLMGVGFVTGLF